MCGIVACDTDLPAAPFLAEALGRLEYRGYDSVGIAVADPDGRVHTLRTVNRVGDLLKRLPDFGSRTTGGIGIGHSRWATHGEVSERNAHPHIDCGERVVVAHNGIIHNAVPLATELTDRGHRFNTAVDSEVIAHLVEEQLEHGDLHAAVLATVEHLEGSWAIVVLDAQTHEIVAATHHSPLVIASSVAGNFVASDISAIAPWITEFRVLEDGDVVKVGAEPRWTRHGEPISAPDPVACTVATSEITLGHHPDFMSKEIDEQPEVADRVVNAWGGAAGDPELWRSFGLPDVSRVMIVACGTSLNAGRAIGSILSQVGGMPHHWVVASEAASTIVEPGTLVIALSQSGETADVLRAIDHLTRSGAPLLAITNNPHSALGRRADAVMCCHAGVEVGVAATKTFVAQVMTGACLALSMLTAHGRITPARAHRFARELNNVPDLLALAIGASKRAVPPLVEASLNARGFIFLGRGCGHVFADEGALKLKELTYRWAESYPAGELKHGPLALVELGTPVLVVDDITGRLDANIAEVRARGAHVIRIGGPGSDIPALGLPADPHGVTSIGWCGPIGSVVAMQIFARQLAVALGRDVDKPRNLAKSVTVE